MKKLSAVMGILALLILSGCATKGFVMEQTDPLTSRIAANEARINDLMTAQKTNSAAIQEAKEMAQKALDMAGRAEMRAADEATRAKAAAKAAEDAAAKAEAAASDADKAAKKCEKMFMMEQKK